MYNLHRLGWSSFQQLCLTVTREILGQTVESFLDSYDGGRDGAFTGTWIESGQDDLSGQFVIQCKFTSKADYVLKVTDVADEVKKAKRLVDKGLCDSYVLITNAGLTGVQNEGIRDLFENVGVKHTRVLGSSWLVGHIRENKHLRMLVPRLYGLGDLSQILDERAYVQARAVLESMREDLSKVVVTDAYQRSADAIDRYGFVLLIGEPASGKTTIASLLSMAAVDQWNASVLKLDEPQSVVERWNPNEPSQFFWLDDTFGVTQYEDSQVSRWNYVLPRIMPMLRSGSKIVMTSRDYIYNRARNHLKAGAFPLLNESQVVIDVHELSTEEREQILYNHIKLGTQPKSFRKRIKPYLASIASHPNFIPETARRLGNPLFTEDLIISEEEVRQFVEGREQLLQEIVLSLDTDSKAALALIYMRNGRLVSPISLTGSEGEALIRLGSDTGKCLAALNALRDSLVRYAHESGESFWQFRHPTVGDAYSTVLTQSPEFVDILIRGSEAERLLRQVTCGDVGLENAVIVPEPLFPLMVSKLKDLPKRSSSLITAWQGRDLQGFLTYRCSKEFLSLYLSSDSDLLTEISEPGMFLDSVPEVNLAKRLYDFSLLPETNRSKFVETVIEYAALGLDPGALTNSDVRSMFTNSDLDNLTHRLQVEVLPRVAEIRSEWETNRPTELPADQYMQPLIELFKALKEEFGAEESAAKVIDNEVMLLEEWIGQNMPWEDENDEDSWLLDLDDLPNSPQSTRSIFYDIDEGEDFEGL